MKKKIKTGYVIKMRNNLFFGSASHRERVLPISSYTTNQPPPTLCAEVVVVPNFSSIPVRSPQLLSVLISPFTAEENFSFHTVFFFFLVCSLDEKQPPIADESVFIPDAPQFHFFSWNERRELSVKNKKKESCKSLEQMRSSRQ